MGDPVAKLEDLSISQWYDTPVDQEWYRPDLQSSR